MKISFAECEEILNHIERLESEYTKIGSKIPRALSGDYAEFKVLSILLKKHFRVERIGGGYSYDILLKPNTRIEVKYSSKLKRKTGAFYWEWKGINPEKFDYLVLVGNYDNHKNRFFIFDSKESKKHIPSISYDWKLDKPNNRSVRIYDTTKSWKEYMEIWEPNKKNTKEIKKLISNHKETEGFINTHKNKFENKWEKIK